MEFSHSSGYYSWVFSSEATATPCPAWPQHRTTPPLIEPSRGRAASLRGFGHLTPFLSQPHWLSSLPTLVTESQGIGRAHGSRTALRSGRRRPVRKLPTCLAAPKDNFRDVGRFHQRLAETVLPFGLFQDSMSPHSELTGRNPSQNTGSSAKGHRGER